MTDKEMQMAMIQTIARVCHQVNKAYCESLGDNSQVDWEEAPEWQKRSAIEGVMYHIEHPDASPEDSHNKWMEVKKADGWIYGAEKDEEKKTHPAMVPYHHLGQEVKSKDYIFRAIVKSFFRT